MWSTAAAGIGGGGPSSSAPAEVLGLEHLAEPLDAPVGDQELDPGPGAQPPVAVVAEDADDAGPDVGHLVQRHPGAEPLGQHRVGRQAAADPEVEARAVLGVDDADERDVVDLVLDVLQRRPLIAVLNLRGRLENSGEPMKRRWISSIAEVPSRISSAAMPATGRAEDDPRGVAARLGRRQADRLEPPPDLRDVLDPDPVQLDVLPVGEVGGVAGELGRDLGDDPQLLGGELAAVDADPQHEELVVELVRLEHRGLAAVDARAALGVEAPPAEPAAQVGRVDTGEAALAVDVLDPGPDVEPVVVLLDALVRVERLEVAQRPLSFAALALRGSCGGCHGARSSQAEGHANGDGGFSNSDDPAGASARPG